MYIDAIYPVPNLGAGHFAFCKRGKDVYVQLILNQRYVPAKKNSVTERISIGKLVDPNDCTRMYANLAFLQHFPDVQPLEEGTAQVAHDREVKSSVKLTRAKQVEDATVKQGTVTAHDYMAEQGAVAAQDDAVNQGAVAAQDTAVKQDIPSKQEQGYHDKCQPQKSGKAEVYDHPSPRCRNTGRMFFTKAQPVDAEVPNDPAQLELMGQQAKESLAEPQARQTQNAPATTTIPQASAHSAANAPLIDVWGQGQALIEMKILDKRLQDGSFPLPEYATDKAAGMDLRAMTETDIVLGPKETFLMPTGIALYIKNPYLCATVLPRSGLGFKHGIVLGNLTGLIDADYQGPLMVPLWNRSEESFTIHVGERIAQLVFVPIVRAQLQIVDEFAATKRGVQGFGSTGVH